MYVHGPLQELDPSRSLRSIPGKKMTSVQARRKVDLPPRSSLQSEWLRQTSSVNVLLLIDGALVCC
jgi:hypothetical protein